MNWLEVEIETTPTDLEETCDALTMHGITGLVIEDESDFQNFLAQNRQYWDYVDESLAASMRGKSRVLFYVEAGDLQILEPLKRRYALSVRQIKEEDWANNWRKYYRPIPIGERLIILPSWEPMPEAETRIPLRLDPGLIFGTGAHPTTQMCLRRLGEMALSESRVLDLGCGSGILGIAARLFGAARVIGCDIDEKAKAVALENAARNGISDEAFSIFTGDVLRGDLPFCKAGEFDLILANIVADVIIKLSALVSSLLCEGGVFLCSGIIDGREDEVLAALAASNFDIINRQKSDDWHCFEAKKRR